MKMRGNRSSWLPVAALLLLAAWPAIGAPANLKVWVYLSDPELATFQTVVKAWEAKTGNQVTVVNYPYFELLGKVEIAFPAGEGPDLCEFPHTDVGVWAQARLIAPYPEGVPSSAEKALYQPAALSAFAYDGRLYGIPQIADMVLLMYNKRLIAKPPATMDELIKTAKALTKGDVSGFLMLDNNFWFGWGFVSGYGGYIFGRTDRGYDPEDIGLFTRGAVQGLDYLLALRKTHKLIPADLDWNVLTGKFTAGKCAMMIMNANQASIYRAAGVDVGMAVIPQLPNGEMPHPLLNISGWALNAFGKQQQAAAELAVYLGANLPVPLFLTSSGNIPVRLDALKDSRIAGNPDAVAATKQVGFADPVPNIPEMGVVWTPTNNAFELAVRGTKTAAQALNEAAQAIRDAIASQ